MSVVAPMQYSYRYIAEEVLYYQPLYKPVLTKVGVFFVFVFVLFFFFFLHKP